MNETTTPQRQPKPFTGKHMLLVMVGAFGVIITVNLMMASLAIGTFPGTIVKNSYVASQDYNQHLAAAKDRAALAWRTVMSQTAERLSLVVHDKSGQAVTGLAIHGRVGRPASNLEDRELSLVEVSQGNYQVPLQLATGRWEVRLHGRDASGALVVAISEEVWVEHP